MEGRLATPVAVRAAGRRFADARGRRATTSDIWELNGRHTRQTTMFDVNTIEFWLQLATRSIEDILELPLMTDPASLATMDVLTKIAPAAFTLMEANFHALAVCWAANLSLERGNSDASCDIYVRLGFIAGDRFGDYKSGSRFGKVGYDLVERWGLKRFQARTYLLLTNFPSRPASGPPQARQVISRLSVSGPASALTS